MTEEELAALGVALNVLQTPGNERGTETAASRWKMASRLPELEMEELRALH